MFSRKGGKPINSGGYGCIFKPALKCKNSKKREHGISKLMTKEHADSEFDTITKFTDTIRKIPNYKDYFLIDQISTCEPSKLTQTDLKAYNVICGSLSKKDFTASNVNTKLSELRSLNLPDAGIDLDNYVSSRPLTVDLIIKINTHMIQLLNNAVIPMNKLNILHMDMKGANIMIHVDDDTFKIIDWGLADIYDGNYVPIVSTNRPIQYNTPFSAILFNDTFQTIYTELLHNTPNILDNSEENNDKLETFIINYYFYWLNERGAGHHHYIELIFRNLILHKFNKFVTNEDITNLAQYYFYTLMVDYIANILKKYTTDDKFDDNLYFKEVYSKNVDVWGLLMTYEILLPQIHSGELTDIQRNEIYSFISELIMNFLYSNSTEPIDTNRVTNYIENFNKILTGETPVKTPAITPVITPAITKHNTHRVATPPPREPTVKSVQIKNSSNTTSARPIKVLKSTAKRKRCPRGTHWNKKTKLCVSKYKKSDKQKQLYKVFGTMSSDTPIPLIVTKKNKKCPPGTRMNKQTRKCDPKPIPKLPTMLASNPLLKKENLPSGVRELLIN